MYFRVEVENKPALKYMNPDILKVGQSHHVLSTLCNIMDNKRAQLKCKLLTGTYILQGNRAACNQHTVDPMCKLCCVAPETRQHLSHDTTKQTKCVLPVKTQISLGSRPVWLIFAVRSMGS